MSTIADHIRVAGTPRGFGDNAIEAPWLAAMESCKALVDIAEREADPAEVYSVELEFVIDPHSGCYGDSYREQGPDLDNLVKLTIDGLTKERRDGMGLGIIPRDDAVMEISATKRKKTGEEATGAFVTIKTV